MRRSRRFRPVVEDAKRREEEAARRLGMAQARLREAEQQLRQLFSYREEYANRLSNTGGLDALRLRDYRCFLARLNQAISEQQARLEQCMEEERRRREEWRALRARRCALGKVQEGYVREERLAAERLEQKELDELALDRLRRREEE